MFDKERSIQNTVKHLRRNALPFVRLRLYLKEEILAQGAVNYSCKTFHHWQGSASASGF